MNNLKENVISVFEEKPVASTPDLVEALELVNPYNKAREIRRKCEALNIKIYNVGRSRWIYKTR